MLSDGPRNEVTVAVWDLSSLWSEQAARGGRKLVARLTVSVLGNPVVSHYNRDTREGQ